jgi:hypothetical protein
VRRRSYKRIHVVGCSPRSGTTLLAELMVNAFRIDGFPEHEMSIFARPRGDYEIVLTKLPGDVLNVRPLLWWWPDLWVICMVRDPRDVVVSQHGNHPGVYYAGLNLFKEGWPAARRLRGHPRFTLIRYEDLVRDPDAIQAELQRRIPFLEKRAAFSDYHRVARPSVDSLKALGGVREVTPRNLGSWRRHKARLVTQLQRHGPITEELIELGYEKDDAWLGELAGVAPDGSTSVRKEYPPLRERARRRWLRLRHTVRCMLGLERRYPLVRREDAA